MTKQSLSRLVLLALVLSACTAAPAPATVTPTVMLPTETAVIEIIPTIEAAVETALPASVTFAVMGDYGQAGPSAEQVAELIDGWDVDFITTTGDNNYPSGAAETIDANIGQYYHEYIGNYVGSYGEGAAENRFFPSLGNHDLDTDNGQPYYDYFTLPANERYYDVVSGSVHIFVLNTDTREPDGVGRSSVQAQWLQSALAASTAEWQVVIAHHPPFSSGLHGPTDYIEWPFGEWGADVMIAGHDHLYERLEVEGFPYFITGLGGSEAVYDFVNIYPGSLVRYNAMHGAIRVEATADWINFQFTNVNGDVIDNYTIEGD
jgi:tartrate-resistant acid phosphatase type 5